MKKLTNVQKLLIDALHEALELQADEVLKLPDADVKKVLGGLEIIIANLEAVFAGTVNVEDFDAYQLEDDLIKLQDLYTEIEARL